jgi:uncharacterized protein YqeY
MANLLEKIKKDLIESQRQKEEIKTQTLRLLLSEIYNYEIAKRGKGENNPLTDEEIIQIIRKEIKKRKEAYELFLKGKREDLASNTEKEINILSLYVPSLLSQEEIIKIIEDLKKQGFSDFNSLMREIMQKYRGQVDGKEVANLIKERLSL